MTNYLILYSRKHESYKSTINQIRFFSILLSADENRENNNLDMNLFR